MFTFPVPQEFLEWYPVECALIEWMCEVYPDEDWERLLGDLNAGEPDSTTFEVMSIAKKYDLTLPPKLRQDVLEHARIGVLGSEWIVPFLEKQAAENAAD